MAEDEIRITRQIEKVDIYSRSQLKKEKKDIEARLVEINKLLEND